jgi:RNA polymerase sigma factor (sigma-70 family)
VDERFIKRILDFDDYIKRFSFKLTKHIDGRDELVQTVYFRILIFLNKERTVINDDLFDNETLLKSWLGAIILNCYKSSLKKRKGIFISYDDLENETDYENYEGSVILGINDDYGDFELDNNQIIKRAIELLGKKSGDKKDVIFRMCDIDNLPYENVSKILNIPLGTVKSRLFRARKFLVKKLQKYYESQYKLVA